MKRGGRRWRRGPQLPLICQDCGEGPVSVRQAGGDVWVRCEACGLETLAFALAAPPAGPDALREAELARLAQVGEPARALYEYLRRYLAEHGYAPTLRDMQTGMGWSSVNTARHHLEALEAAGLIARDYAAARGLRLLAG